MEEERTTYTENIDGYGTKDGEEEERRAVCANQTKYHGAETQENPKYNWGTGIEGQTTWLACTFND